MGKTCCQMYPLQYLIAALISIARLIVLLATDARSRIKQTFYEQSGLRFSSVVTELQET